MSTATKKSTASFIGFRRLMSIIPTDEHGMARLGRFPMGEAFLVNAWQPRNLQFLQKYWVLVGVLHANLPDAAKVVYPSNDSFSDALKLMAGHRESAILPRGFTFTDPATGEVRAIGEDTWAFRPGSIAFDNLDEDSFSDFFDNVCQVVREYFIPGLNNEELLAHVESLIERRF